MNQNDDKVEIMREHILAICKQQGFTVYEFEMLVMKLGTDCSERQRKVNDELF